MKKRLQQIITSCLVVLGIAALTSTVLPAHVFADDAASNLTNGLNAVGGNENKTSLEDNIKTIVNIMLFLLGSIAVIMIIIGGIRYATSNGDSSQIKGAKDTILYAVIGLIVAILAYAIVSFVITQFVKK
jgi:hypothetical protein